MAKNNNAATNWHKVLSQLWSYKMIIVNLLLSLPRHFFACVSNSSLEICIMTCIRHHMHYTMHILMCIIRKNNNTKPLKFFEGKLSLANLIFPFKYFTVHSGEQWFKEKSLSAVVRYPVFGHKHQHKLVRKYTNGENVRVRL